MSEKVVLPKFDLPGDQMHPAMKMLWMVGGLMALAMLALGVALAAPLDGAGRRGPQAGRIAAKTAEANAVAEAAKARPDEAAAKSRSPRRRRRRSSRAKTAPPPAGAGGKAERRSPQAQRQEHSSKTVAKSTVTEAGGDER